MKSSYDAAVIGLGRIGFSLAFDKKREQPAAHCAAFTAEKRIHLIAGCDCDTDACARWKKSYPKLPVYNSVQDLLTESHPDIVTVAVNESQHKDTINTVLAAQPRLVILEKPVALTVAECTEIKKIAESFAVPVMINHERRFSADYCLVKKLLPRIGMLQDVRGSLWSGMRVYDQREDTTGNYSLIHDGTHLIDTVSFLLDTNLTGPVLSSVFTEKDGVVRNVAVSYTLPSGTSVSLSFSGRSRYFGFSVDMYGTEGRLHIGNGFCNLYLRKESSLYTGFYSLQKQPISVPRKTGYFKNMVAHAADFLDGKTPLLSTLDDGIDDLRVIEDIKSLLIKNGACN